MFVKHETAHFVQAALSHTHKHLSKITGTLPLVTKNTRMEMIENYSYIKYNEMTFPWKMCQIIIFL